MIDIQLNIMHIETDNGQDALHFSHAVCWYFSCSLNCASFWVCHTLDLFFSIGFITWIDIAWVKIVIQLRISCIILKQVFKVIWQQAASPPHTDGSVVFARWCQCALPPNTWFLGPTRVLDPNGISISSAVFAGLTAVTDRPTDRQTTLLGL